MGSGSSSSSGLTWNGHHPRHFLILKIEAVGDVSKKSKLHCLAVFAGDGNFANDKVTSPKKELIYDYFVKDILPNADLNLS